MAGKIDIDKLSEMIKSKRGSKGLRIVAKEIGNISASTLSRIELGNLPDLETFMLLCSWLEVSPEEFQNNEEKKHTTQNKIVAHLRAERTLSKETTNALIEMINLAYNSKKKTDGVK